jgi:CubicO group peptidase (beta-lactamase class C family)
VPITPSTLFGAASISKQFTCMCLAILAERGALTLEDRVREHVPELDEYAAPITLEQLMNHTSGMRELWELMTLAGWRWSDRWTHEDALRIVLRQRTGNFAPGTDWAYCNSSYVLLAEVIRRVTGRGLRAIADELIFAPLGMRSTCFRDDPAELMPGRARGYEGKEPFVLSEPNSSLIGTTGLFTTVEDLCRWDANFGHGCVGGQDVLDRLTTPAVLRDGRATTYALGLHVRRLDGRRVLEHSGGHAGYHAHYLRLPDDALSVVVLANTGVPAPAIAVAIARRMLGRSDATAWIAPRGSLRVTDAVYRHRRTGYALRVQPSAGGPVLGFVPDAASGQQSEILVTPPHRLSPVDDAGTRAVIDHDDRQEIVLDDDGATLTLTTVNAVFPSTFDRVADALGPPPADAVLGRFRSDELETTLEARLVGGRLQLQAPRLGRLSLERVDADVFASGGLTVEVRDEGLLATTLSSRDIVFAREP